MLVAKAKRYPDLDPAACETFLTLRQVGDAVRLAQEHRLAAEGISSGRFMVLAVLDRTPDQPLPASELAEAAGVTKQTVTSLLDGLERDGLVARQPCLHDRRSVRVRLEPAGRDLLAHVLPGLYRAQVEIMADLSADERHELTRLLRKVRTDPATVTPCGGSVPASREGGLPTPADPKETP